jgi:hypothetical protein
MSTVPNAIIAAAQAQGLDPALALEVAFVESSFNPNALGPPTPYGQAVGLFQLMPSTAQQLGVDPSDVTQNIQGGITYLRMMLSQFGDPTAALAAYNWGPGNVQKAISANGSGWFSTIPASVQNYTSKILNNLQTQYTAVTAFTAAAAGVPYPGGGTSTLTIPDNLLPGVSFPAPAGFSWGTVALVMGLILGVGLVLYEI